MIEDSDDSGASGSEDEKDTSKTNASSSAKGSSVKSVNAVARKGEHVIPGTILGHVKGIIILIVNKILVKVQELRSFQFHC